MSQGFTVWDRGAITTINPPSSDVLNVFDSGALYTYTYVSNSTTEKTLSSSVGITTNSIRDAIKTIEYTFTATCSFLRNTVKTIGSTIISSGLQVKSVASNFTSNITSLGAVLRDTSKIVESLTYIEGFFSYGFSLFKNLSSNLNINGNISRSTSKLMEGLSTAYSDISKFVLKLSQTTTIVTSYSAKSIFKLISSGAMLLISNLSKVTLGDINNVIHKFYARSRVEFIARSKSIYNFIIKR